MTASQHMVQANGMRFRAMVDGPAAGEMAILLHGFPEGAESWTKQVDALARAGALAVAPDTRGYGLSDAPPNVSDYEIGNLIADVAGLIKAFGRDRAHIAGHDWGAIVAWFFASHHPEMTKSLTVLSVGHPAAAAAAIRNDEDQAKRSEYIRLFLVEGKAEEVLTEDDSRRIRVMFRDIAGPAAEHFIRSISRPGRLTAALNYYRANFGRGLDWWSRAKDVKVEAPTVLLWGDQDAFLGRWQAEHTRDHMTHDYRLDVLEGAGHWLQFERPDEVSRALVGAAL
jgi:pimeloyl-ACP methyl ester carboxylesterase